MTCSKLLVVGLLFVAGLPVLGEEPAKEQGAAVSINGLIDELASPDVDVRKGAIAAIAKRGKEAGDAVPALLEQLDFSDFGVCAAAAEALGEIGLNGDKVVPVLIEHFPAQGYVIKWEPRRDAVPLFAVYASAAARFGEQAVDPLIEALGSESPQVMLAAAVGLETLGEPAAKATPQLIAMLESDNTLKRRAAAGTIRGIGPGASEAVPALVKMLHDENFHNQYWACRALGAIGPKAADATADLLDQLSEGVVSVRRNAAMALGNIGPDIGAEAAGKLIEAVYGDGMAPVREEAVIALGKLKPFADDSVPVLKKALGDTKFPAPTHAARSLWLLTGDAGETLPGLLRCLDDLTYFQNAVEVLGEMGPAAAPAVDRLAKALTEPDPDDRVSAVYALARIGAPGDKVEAAIRKGLDDEESQVREAAGVALKSLSTSHP